MKYDDIKRFYNLTDDTIAEMFGYKNGASMKRSSALDKRIKALEFFQELFSSFEIKQKKTGISQNERPD